MSEEQWAGSRCKHDVYSQPSLPKSGLPSPIWSFGMCLADCAPKSKNYRCLHPKVLGPKMVPCGESYDYPEAGNIWNGHFKARHSATYESVNKERAKEQAASGSGAGGEVHSAKRGGDGGWYTGADSLAILRMQVWAVVWCASGNMHTPRDSAQARASYQTAPHAHMLAQVRWYSHLFRDAPFKPVSLLCHPSQRILPAAVHAYNSQDCACNQDYDDGNGLQPAARVRPLFWKGGIC